MENSSKLSTSVLRALRQYRLQLDEIDRPGSASELLFIEDDSWLYDTVVVERQLYKNGKWELHLLYVQKNFPLKFVKRKLHMSRLEKSPEMTALRRNTATTALDDKFFDFSEN